MLSYLKIYGKIIGLSFNFCEVLYFVIHNDHSEVCYFNLSPRITCDTSKCRVITTDLKRLLSWSTVRLEAAGIGELWRVSLWKEAIKFTG